MTHCKDGKYQARTKQEPGKDEVNALCWATSHNWKRRLQEKGRDSIWRCFGTTLLAKLRRGAPHYYRWCLYYIHVSVYICAFKERTWRTFQKRWGLSKGLKQVRRYVHCSYIRTYIEKRMSEWRRSRPFEEQVCIYEFFVSQISQYVPDEAEASSNWDYFRLIVQRRSLRAIDVVGIGGAGRSLTAAVLASAGPGTSVVVGGGGHRCLRPPARPAAGQPPRDEE